MRFKQFIIEQTQLNETRSEGDFAIKALSDKEWADWVEQYCSDYLPRAGNYPIYRGIKNETVKLGVKDTNEFTRRSASTVNYYTLWMDNAIQWKDYPKRSKSFIGSPNYYTVIDYGEPYLLFPADDAKIGICPKVDIWRSFGEVPGRHLGNFALLIERTFKKIYGDAAAARAMVDWLEFKRLLELTAFSEFIEVNKFYVKHSQFAQKNYSKLIDYFEDVIVPEKHGFQHTTPANYLLSKDDKKEVWVQGRVALVKVNFKFFNVKDNSHPFPKTSKLFSKYNIRGPYRYSTL